MELSVSRSWSDERDVLCVSDQRTGREVGRFDRRSGEFEVDDPARAYDVAQALWDFLDYGEEYEAPHAAVAVVGEVEDEAATEDEAAPEDEATAEDAAVGEAWSAAGVMEEPEIRELLDEWYVPAVTTEPLLASVLSQISTPPDIAAPTRNPYPAQAPTASRVPYLAPAPTQNPYLAQVQTPAPSQVPYLAPAQAPTQNPHLVQHQSQAQVAAATQNPYLAQAQSQAQAPAATQNSYPVQVQAQTPAASQVPALLQAPAPAPAPAEPAVSAGARHRGGKAVDRALARLRRDGWAVLSPGGKRVGADFDRLIIGPAGVFALTVKQGGDLPSRAHERGHDAGSATRKLSAATGMAVKVRPVIVFVGAETKSFDACGFQHGDGEPCDVLAARGENIVDVLWSLPAVYSAQERHRFLDVARHADFWRAA